MNEWISVKDRWPSHGDHVIASDGKVVGEASFEIISSKKAKKVFGRFLDIDGWESLDDITHWMELPPPPK